MITIKRPYRFSNNCQVCGKSFRAKFSTHRKYCSLECYHKTHGNPPISFNCSFCGKEFKRKAGEVKRGAGKYCSHRCCMKAVMKGRTFSSEHKEKLSLLKKGMPSAKKGISLAEKIKTKIRASLKKLWKDEIYVRKQMKARGVKPNKAERKLLDFLNEHFPNEWAFVGDGKIIIEGKCPDFINTNGKKLIIELFGNYWHKKDNPEERQVIFRPYGYETLVIWENELKSPDALLQKIQYFS